MPSPARGKLLLIIVLLRTPRRRLAGAERGSRVSQALLNRRCERVRASKHAPRNTFRVFKRRHGLTDIAERRAAPVGGHTEHNRVNLPHLEREFIAVSENASRDWNCFAQQ